jgi:hypothetical protein
MTTYMIILNSFTEKKIEIINPQHIPRIGESVDMGYGTNPIVQAVRYRYTIRNPDEHVDEKLDVSVWCR